MDTPLTTTQGMWRLLLAAAVTVALFMTLAATPAAAASPTACRVQNTETDKTYTALQEAVDAAKPGARLIVKGTCVGTTVIDKDLVIEGKRTKRTGKPALSGARKVRVMGIEQGAQVTLRDLLITRGLALRGAGIRNRGDLTLRDVQVRRNSNGPLEVYGRGGYGVYNEGRLRLNGATRIAGNQGFAETWGEVFNRDTLVMNGTSSIGTVNNGRYATLTMNRTSSLRGGSYGQLHNWGRVTMNDASWVRPDNDRMEGESGPGVVNLGTFTMNDSSSIGDGLDQSSGVQNSLPGGAPFTPHATFTMNDSSSISGNPGRGLENYQDGLVRMNHDSSIHDNTEYCDGGGVRMNGGRLRMTGASSITANTVIDHGIDDEWQCYDGVRGGGIWQLRGTLIGVICGPEAGANVTGNTPDDCLFEP